MIKLKLLLAAILGSILAYYIINVFLMPVTIFQYLIIETIITFFHSLYNVLKNNIEIKSSN
jgi:hypothetical protein